MTRGQPSPFLPSRSREQPSGHTSSDGCDLHSCCIEASASALPNLLSSHMQMYYTPLTYSFVQN